MERSPALGWLRNVRRLTEREVWLLALLGLVALVTLAATALQWSGGQRERYASAQSDLMTAREDRATARARTLNASELAQLGAIADWSVHGRNLWRARLSVEQVVYAAAQAAKLPTPDIKVAEALEENAQTPLLRVEVTGPYVAGPWLSFMHALAFSQTRFVIDKLDVSDAETAQYTLVLLFPVTLDQAPAAPLATTP